MRILHLYWPHLLLRLAQSRSPEPFAKGPIVLGGKPWSDGRVLDASKSAMEFGVRLGQSLGAAHRLAPEATFLEPNLDADEAHLKSALERVSGLSPSVAAETAPEGLGFGRIEMQLDGLERLWGAESEIVRLASEAVATDLPGPPLAGVAGTRFVAAVAAAMVGGHVERSASGGAAAREPRFCLVPPGGEAEFLAPLPASLLSRDPNVRARLERFGLRAIGQIAELPRSALVARFGPEGERIGARSRGEETDSFRPWRTPQRMEMSLPIEPPVADVEGIRFVLHRLAAVLGDQLAGRGAATGRVRLRLELDGTFVAGDVPEALSIDQYLPEPTSEGLAVERLLLARLETAPPPAPVSRLTLELMDVAPAVGCQLALFTPQIGKTGRLAWQLARLGLRFGEEKVGWVELTDAEATLAEERWRWRSEGAAR
jgi:protein ImuB